LTKAQEVYERVEALTATGVKKAEAFRQLADEFGQPFNSLRGSYYAHVRTLGGPPAQPRQRRSMDPIESATAVLEQALEGIDNGIAAAKQRVDEAKAEYDHLRETATERKAQIKAKIDVLKA
jgi:hypothetical protein